MEKIAKFQELLKRNDIDVYIICTSDEHFDEYLPDLSFEYIFKNCIFLDS